MNKNSVLTFISGIALASLTACGGGGGGGVASTPAPTSTLSAEGVYAGTLKGGPNPAFQLLVLENGDSWALYGTQTTSTFYVAGFDQGTVTSSSGTLSSTNTKDFGFSPGVASSLTGTYDAVAKTVSASIVTSGATVTATGGPSTSSLYDYSKAASLSTISGNWTLTSLQGEGIALSISSTGAISANSNLGCKFTGTAVPRSSGKNVFNVSVTFGPAPCALPGMIASGIAVSYPLANGQTQLIVAAVDGNRQYGTAAFGVR